MIQHAMQLLMAPQGEEGGGGFSFFIFIGLFFVIIYFFMIRPNQKKAKDQRAFMEAIKKGDRVVTIGGIHGKVLEVGDTNYTIEIAEGIRIKVEKSALSLDFTRTAQGGTTKK